MLVNISILPKAFGMRYEFWKDCGDIDEEMGVNKYSLDLAGDSRMVKGVTCFRRFLVTLTVSEAVCDCIGSS